VPSIAKPCSNDDLNSQGWRLIRMWSTTELGEVEKVRSLPRIKGKGAAPGRWHAQLDRAACACTCGKAWTQGSRADGIYSIAPPWGVRLDCVPYSWGDLSVALPCSAPCVMPISSCIPSALSRNLVRVLRGNGNREKKKRPPMVEDAGKRWLSMEKPVLALQESDM
jgi:hypothetical protein